MYFYNLHIHSSLPPWNPSIAPFLSPFQWHVLLKQILLLITPWVHLVLPVSTWLWGHPLGHGQPPINQVHTGESVSIHTLPGAPLPRVRPWGPFLQPWWNFDWLGLRQVLCSWSNHSCCKLMFCLLQFGIESEPIPEDIEDPKAYRYGTFDNY